MTINCFSCGLIKQISICYCTFFVCSFLVCITAGLTSVNNLYCALVIFQCIAMLYVCVCNYVYILLGAFSFLIL